VKAKDEQSDFELRWRVVLRLLSSRSLGRKQLMDYFIVKTGGSPSTFECTFGFLVRTGRVVKSDGAHLAPYVVTERGRKFLEALS
jgi:hypothetical protein